MFHLAIDIGASSGRHILGWLENGKLKQKEVYRFSNGLDDKNGTLCWNTDRLFKEIKTGMTKCREAGMVPDTMSIDTWGVDYVLLDKEGKVIGDAVGYRDSRTEGISKKVFSTVSKRELYDITGIKSGEINTLFQLAALKEQHPEQLENAADFLMLPDYFVYLLTGKKYNEYTNASTTELVDVKTNNWSYDLISWFGINKNIFRDVTMPGAVAGRLSAKVKAEVGFDLDVILAASHDTASAVMAVPSNNRNVMYISSGTWSLMGIESTVPQLSDSCMDCLFTNEGGYEHRYRILKNIMGLWMIQNVKHELDDKYSFAELCDMAEKESDFGSLIDALDNRFLAPKNMSEEIKQACRDTGEAVPETPGQLAAVIYNSLAKCYSDCADQLEKITGNKYDTINIIGGGSNAEYLNRITAKISGRKILAGPGEATAIGNLINQMIASGEIKSLADARDTVKNSFEIKEYK